MKRVFFITLIQLTALFVCAQELLPQKGTYDGMIGNDRIILVAETDNLGILKGYFVVNRGKSIEESHPFSLNISERKPFFQSDLYVGKLNKSRKRKSFFFSGLRLT